MKAKTKPMKAKTFLVTVCDGSTRSREYDHQFMVSYPLNCRGAVGFRNDYYRALHEARQIDGWNLADVMKILKSQGWEITTAKTIEVEY